MTRLPRSTKRAIRREVRGRLLEAGVLFRDGAPLATLSDVRIDLREMTEADAEEFRRRALAGIAADVLADRGRLR